MSVSLAQVAAVLESFAPLGLAEAWDRPGLQVGDPEAPLEAVLVALDPSPRAASVARRTGAQLLLTHHPLLLTSLPVLDLSTPRGKLIGDCLRDGLSVYSCHTNLDRAEGGVNDALAERLGLRQLEPLGKGEGQLKLVATVPAGYEPKVRRALRRVGAGRLGRYAGCTFGCRGTGAFEPLPGASPFVGAVGEPGEADETRIEAVVPRSLAAAARRAVLEVHPYEQPALDLYPLEGTCAQGALGRVGDLPASLPLRAWAAEVGRRLGAPGVRFVGDPEARISRVAVCGGSGAVVWEEARAAGAEVLVTGDVRHHAARDAEAAGFCLVDAGHAATEAVAIECLAGVLRRWSSEGDAGLRIEVFREPDPFSWVVEK